MKKLWKKTLCLVLAMTMVMAVTYDVPASAVGCNHDYSVSYTEDHYAQAGDNCKHWVETGLRCSKCDQKLKSSVKTSSFDYPDHSYYASSSCDGTTITVIRECRHCGYVRSEQLKCPLGPHSGPCPVPSITGTDPIHEVQ